MALSKYGDGVACSILIFIPSFMNFYSHLEVTSSRQVSPYSNFIILNEESMLKRICPTVQFTFISFYRYTSCSIISVLPVSKSLTEQLKVISSLLEMLIIQSALFA
jgi:hypothetical protein